MYRRLIKSRKGLTLVEVLVALFVLTLVMGSFINVFMTARLNVTAAIERTKALNLLSYKMEWIKGQSYLYLKTYSEAIDNVDSDETSPNALINDTRITTVSEDSNGNLIITVILNWEKKGLAGFVGKGTLDNPDERLVTLIIP